MSLFKKQQPNIEAVAQLLNRNLKVKVNGQSVVKCLREHPHYPSLSAMSDCLNGWGVENQVFKVETKDFQTDDLSFPFLAHFKAQEGRLVLVRGIQDKQVYCGDEKKSHFTLSLEEFLNKWDGIVLYAEADEDSGEKNYWKNRIKYVLEGLRLPALILLAFALCSQVFRVLLFPQDILLLSIVKAMGLSVTILLLLQSIQNNNPFVQNLCRLGGKSDCNAILKSEAAKVTSWLSWAEVGFFYFSGSLLSLLLVPSSVSLLAWLNLLVLPYTVYSIAYQYRHKNWCVLCCAVQLLLVLEAVAFNMQSGAYEVQGVQLSTYFPLLLCFFTPVILWSFLKVFFLAASKLPALEHQLKRFKYNSGLFQQALGSQPRYRVTDDLIPIVLGNAEAETIITMVSNPFCGPCAKAHQFLDQWLKERDDIQLKIIFTRSNQDDDRRSKVIRHITSLSLLHDKEKVKEALNDWYNQSSTIYEEWAIKYPIHFNETISEVGQKQQKWCEMAEIEFTPAILVNGHKLPEPYRLEDLKYII